MGTVISGTNGADAILAADDTVILGLDGDDTLTAGGRNVVLVGEGGDDVLLGSEFSDVLGGSAGDNTLTGGAGDDVFVVELPVEDGEALQTVTDFEVGLDRIGLPLGLAIDDVEAVTLRDDLGAVSTQIRLVSSEAVLAVLPGIDGDRLTSHDFVVAETLEFGAAEFQVREDGVPLTAVTVIRSFPELSRLTTTFSFDLLVSRAGGTETDVAAENLRVALFGGDRNLTVMLPLIDDDVPEPDEVFSLQLVPDPERLQLGEQSTALVTVVDDDSIAPPITPGGTVGFASSVVRVNEDDGTAELTVLRSGGSQGAVSVGVAVADGTAIAGSDFLAAPEPTTVTFADGELAAAIVTIPLLDDQLQEDLESFTVTLSDPIGGATLGTSVATVEIVDQDALPAGLVEFSEPSFSVVEGVSLVTVPVIRTDGSNGRVTVNVAVVGGTAVEGVDFTSPPGPIGLVFEDGETGPKDITFAIADDALVEGPESFSLTLFNPVGGVALGANQSTTVVIADNDQPAIAVDFSAASDLEAFPVDPLTGVRFSENALGIVNFEGGGSGNFVDPLLAPSTPAQALTYTGVGTMIVNVDGGFRDRLSFRYGAPFALNPAVDPDGDGLHEVLIFDGPNGSGNVLAIAELPLTDDTLLPIGAFGLTETPFEVAFNGVAQSVAIGSEGDRLVIDDLVFG